MRRKAFSHRDEFDSLEQEQQHFAATLEKLNNLSSGPSGKRLEHDNKILIVKTTKEEPINTVGKPVASYKNDLDYVFVNNVHSRHSLNIISGACHDILLY